MHHAKVIVNPSAGGGAAGRMWPRIRQMLNTSLPAFDHDFTEGTGHGTRLARQAVEQGYGLVVAVGGDGTVNEVANGLLDGGGRGRATLGIISAGTGSDCARMLDIPHDCARACKLLADYRPLAIDIGVVEYNRDGRIERRYFVNTAGLGFDAAVVQRMRQFKLSGSRINFMAGFLATFITYSGKQLEISMDGRRQRERGLLLAVNNGRYFGGAMKIAPDADPCDGLLDVVIVKDTGKASLLWNFPRVYRGTHINHPNATACRASQIEVESPQRVLLQVDGELVGEAPARFRLLPAALSVATQ